MKTLPMFLRIEQGIDTCPQLKRKYKMPRDEQERILCPCCNEPLHALADIIQWGMYDDRYITYLYCKPCDTAYEYRYKMSSLALSDPIDEVVLPSGVNASDIPF